MPRKKRQAGSGLVTNDHQPLRSKLTLEISPNFNLPKMAPCWRNSSRACQDFALGLDPCFCEKRPSGSPLDTEMANDPKKGLYFPGSKICHEALTDFCFSRRRGLWRRHSPITPTRQKSENAD
jgi:hypothetical protein